MGAEILSSLARHWRGILIGVVSLLAWHWHSRLIDVHAEFDAFQRKTEAQSKQAETNQAAVNHVPAILSKVIAEKSNDQAPAYYDAVHVAAERMRKDGPRCPIAASVPGTDSAPEVIHGPDPAADMVSRPRAEDDLIVNAAGRAAQMHADALELIANGAAVASPPAKP